MPKIIPIIVARNEAGYISETVKSLRAQTVTASPIIVVDDGSTDKTGEIAKKLGCEVISLPYHSSSLIGRPELAARWNAGLEQAERHASDYILILGADHPLPQDYLERLIDRMEGIAVVSGRIIGEPYIETAPRGSGRLVDAKFWMKANFLRFPIAYGWESWLCFKAMEMGYGARCFRDVETEVSRRTSMRNPASLGRGMYALGYDWKYALARCLVTFFKRPRAGPAMFWGWLRHEGTARLDVAEYVGEMQQRRLWSRVWKFIRRRGRQ